MDNHKETIKEIKTMLALMKKDVEKIDPMELLDFLDKELSK